MIRTDKNLEKSEKILSLSGAEAVFIDCGYLTRYLTGFAVEDGYTLVDKEGTTLYTDKRYLEAAQKFLQNTSIAVREIDKNLPPEKLLSRYQTVAIAFAETSVTRYKMLEKCGATLLDATTAFAKTRAIKTQEELSYIQRACEIAERAFEQLLPRIKEGTTEREVAALLEYLMRKEGADGTSFDTIVAFGEHAAVPHHATGDRLLAFGDEILMDFGCKVEGYCSDMTRTMLYGDDGKHEAFKKAYQAVLTAHQKVLSEVKIGMTAGQADEIARGYLTAQGYGEYFTHSLGHGIGLQIHEFPTLTKGRETPLEDGMVFSNEPGVYVAGEYGIRIEDTVTMQSGAIVSLMKTKKDLIIL